MATQNAQSRRPRKANHSKPYFQFLDRLHHDDYRREEIESLVRAIRTRENRLLLGLPGCGLSNLLRFLVSKPELIKRDVTFAYVACAELDPTEFQQTLFAKIAQQLSAQDSGAVAVPGAHGYELLSQLLTQVGGDPFSRIAIVINGADVLPGAVDELFYRRLRALSDHNKRVCFIVGASPQLNHMIDPQNILFAGRRLVVGSLNERDYRNAIVEIGERIERPIGAQESEELMRLTGGFPSLLKEVCAAVDCLKLDLTLFDADASDVLLSHEGVRTKCAEIWCVLEPVSQSALQLIADGKPQEAHVKAIHWLRTHGIVTEQESGFGLFSSIFQAFVRDQQAVRPIEPAQSTLTRPELVTVENGKVYKGGREVRVSNKEYRLIACLKREKRIYSKEEIIECVWDEGERKVGISDETLSNVVARVRRRIGSTHIKTHFGRGFEFLG